MVTFKPDNEFRSGKNMSRFELEVKSAIAMKANVHLDLSDVIYMDSGSFRFVFNAMKFCEKITPPESEKVKQRFNDWLDSKKFQLECNK